MADKQNKSLKNSIVRNLSKNVCFFAENFVSLHLNSGNIGK
jgi:hypothetical protein